MAVEVRGDKFAGGGSTESRAPNISLLKSPELVADVLFFPLEVGIPKRKAERGAGTSAHSPEGGPREADFAQPFHFLRIKLATRRPHLEPLRSWIKCVAGTPKRPTPGIRLSVTSRARDCAKHPKAKILVRYGTDSARPGRSHFSTATGSPGCQLDLPGYL